MSLEAIKEVTQAEEEAKRRKAEAAANAKKAVADAERDGRAGLEESRAQAEVDVRNMMYEAEKSAGVRTASISEQTAKDCEDLKKAAEAKLEEAAELIVGKVVNIT